MTFQYSCVRHVFENVQAHQAYCTLLNPLISYLAVWKVAFSEEPAAPNETPTASPSGILWTVIATTRSMIRFHCDCRASSARAMLSR